MNVWLFLGLALVVAVVIASEWDDIFHPSDEPEPGRHAWRFVQLDDDGLVTSHGVEFPGRLLLESGVPVSELAGFVAWLDEYGRERVGA